MKPNQKTIKKGRPRRKLVLFCVLAVLVLGGTWGGFSVYNYGRNAGWWGENDRTKLLKNDPMASKRLLALSLIRSEESGTPGFSIETPPGYINNFFSINTKYQSSVQEELQNLAEKSGWHFKPNVIGSTDGGWVGEKTTKEGYQFSLSIRSLESKDNTGSQTITIEVSLW